MRSPKYPAKYTALLMRDRSALMLLWAALLLAWCVGIFGRAYWTPDEPREADIAWRMSWQSDKAVPLLAGEAFCEKPPLTYWLAAIPIRLFGMQAAAARLPNLLYAVIGALAVGLLARRSVGPVAGIVAATAFGTFLLAYQVAIWLATDAPLLAAVAVALLGVYIGFYGTASGERLRGYTLMHIALGLGFLCKSAAAWMVPAMTLIALIVWERRWRELARWELYAALPLQAAMILAWVWIVYAGPDGAAHLKVFFWNNLVGRFAQIDVPAQLQYTAGHRNTPGKYLLELPLYLFPWTLLVAAAVRRAWLERKSSRDDYRAVRFAIAASLPALILLSFAATARNIYLAPALPGVAMLLAWWARQIAFARDRCDLLALRATAGLLMIAVVAAIAALCIVAADARDAMPLLEFIAISGAGVLLAGLCVINAWRAAPTQRSLWFLSLGYCALLAGPASQIYPQVDSWQDLPAIARAVGHDAGDRPLILLAPDETTQAMIDMYARTHVAVVALPTNGSALADLRTHYAAAPRSLALAQLPKLPDRNFGLALGSKSRQGPLGPAPPTDAQLPWANAAGLRVTKTYSLPHGRRYALLEPQASLAPAP